MTVLLVERDAHVRRLAAAMLALLGYATTAAATGAEALAHLETDAYFDLLLTAAVLDDMDAKMLGERARRSHPQLSLLCISGYDENWLRQGRRAIDDGYPLLPKPFTMAQLKAAVESVLRTRS